MNRSIFTLAVAALVACSSLDTPAPVVAPPVARASAELVVPVADADPRESVVSAVDIEPPTSPSPLLPVGPEPTRYTLRRGETLAHFARWSGVPVEEIAATSALGLDDLYAVGTEIAIAVDPEVRARIEQRRDAHHQTRAQAYLASRSASGTTFYAVRTGDSAWGIAQGHNGMPVWLLESMNPSVDLERLRPGQELLVPVFSDIVVEVPEAVEPALDPDVR